MISLRKSVTGAVVILTLLLPAIAGAQNMPGFDQAPEMEPVDEEELEEFVETYVGVVIIQNEYFMRIENHVEESPMEVERFHELNSMAQQTGSLQDLPGVDESESEDFATVMEDVGVMQQAMQEAMVERVQDDGFAVERFNEILVAMETDQELAGRAGEMLEEEWEQQQPEDAEANEG